MLRSGKYGSAYKRETRERLKGAYYNWEEDKSADQARES